jgi:hypothetical protein
MWASSEASPHKGCVKPYFAIFGELYDLFSRSQPFPRAAERQLNAKGRGGENVDFPSFNFLKVAGGDFSPFGQGILRQVFADPFPAHVGPENFNPLPFFFGNRHDILHRFYDPKMNDTYIVN